MNSVSFVDKVFSSDVFSLLDQFNGNKVLASNKSMLKQTAFYNYAKVYPFRDFIKGKSLTRKQCKWFVGIIDRLSKSYPNKLVVDALFKCDFTDELEQNVLDKLNETYSAFSSINETLKSHYVTIEINGFSYPIFPRTDVKVDPTIQLLAFSLWSISTSTTSNFNKIKQFVEFTYKEHFFIYKHESSFSLLEELAGRVTKNLSSNVVYRSTELLITTNSIYKQEILQLLTSDGSLINE